jgi:hypothetical protein
MSDAGVPGRTAFDNWHATFGGRVCSGSAQVVQPSFREVYHQSRSAQTFTNSFTTAALPFVKDPVAGAFGLFRLQLGSIFGYVLVPLFIMFSLAGTVGTITRGDKAFQVDAELSVASNSADLDERQRALLADTTDKICYQEFN